MAHREDQVFVGNNSGRGSNAAHSIECIPVTPRPVCNEHELNGKQVKTLLPLDRSTSPLDNLVSSSYCAAPLGVPGPLTGPVSGGCTDSRGENDQNDTKQNFYSVVRLSSFSWSPHRNGQSSDLVEAQASTQPSVHDQQHETMVDIGVSDTVPVVNSAATGKFTVQHSGGGTNTVMDGDECTDAAGTHMMTPANRVNVELGPKTSNRTFDVPPRQIMDVMRISGRDKGIVGIRKLRTQKLAGLEKTHRGHVVRIVKNIVSRTCKAFVPNDHEQLMYSVFNELGCESAVQETLKKCLSICPLRSIEKRLLRSIIVGVIGGQQARKIIADDVSYTTHSHGGDDSDDADGNAEDEERSMQPDENAVNSSNATSVQVAQNGQPRYWYGGCRRMLRRAEEDWHHFITTGFIPEVKRRNKKTSDESVKESVSFVFSNDNRQLLAHGTKIICTQDGDVLDIPKIRRTKSRMEIWRAYDEYKKNNRDVPKVGRSLLMRMISSLTSGQQNLNAFVDYHLVVLVFENVQLLQYIIKRRVQDVQQQYVLGKQLIAIENFLRYGCYTHVNSDSDVAHNDLRALAGNSAEGSACTDTEHDCRTNCMECLKPFQVIENIRMYVRQESDGVKAVLDEAANKFKLFMGHQLRRHVQHTMFTDATRTMLESAPEEVAIIVMDHKMKFEPRKFRQKSPDWCERKGISWHSSVVTYKVRQNNDDDVPEGDKVKVKNVYLNHIPNNDSNQTAFAVCSILELVCRQVRLLIPSLQRVILQVDCSENYSNRIFPVAAPFICMKHGFRLDKVLYNETQEEKGPTDVHFSVATKHVDKYIEENQLDIVTPADLVRAINHGDGVKGCIAELYEVDMEHKQAKIWTQAFGRKADAGGLGNLGRPNEIRYMNDDDISEHIYADTYAYKYSAAVRWAFRIGSSARLGLGEETETVAQPYNADIEDEITNEVSGTDTGVSATKMLFCGPITGVRLISSGYVKRASVVVKSKKKILISSTVGDETDEEASGDEHNYPVPTEEQRKNMAYKQFGDCFLCSKCGHSFRDKSTVLHHHAICRQSSMSELYIDRAARLLKYSIQTGDIEVHLSPSENKDLQSLSVSNHVRETVQFPPLWAARPGIGDSLGMNFIDEYKPQITEMVEQGNKGRKLSTGQMQEQLQLLNPDRYNIPSTHHIDQYVKSVFASLKTVATASPAPKLQERYRMPVIYSQNLELIVQNNMNIKVSEAETALLVALNITDSQKGPDFPNSERIKNKISSLKTKIRKQRGR